MIRIQTLALALRLSPGCMAVSNAEAAKPNPMELHTYDVPPGIAHQAMSVLNSVIPRDQGGRGAPQRHAVHAQPAGHERRRSVALVRRQY